MATKYKLIKFSLERIEMVYVDVPPENIPWNWMCLRMLVIPVDRRRKVKYCAVMVDPIRYKKDQKFKKRLLAKLRREIQKSYKP